MLFTCETQSANPARLAAIDAQLERLNLELADTEEVGVVLLRSCRSNVLDCGLSFFKKKVGVRVNSAEGLGSLVQYPIDLAQCRQDPRC